MFNGLWLMDTATADKPKRKVAVVFKLTEPSSKIQPKSLVSLPHPVA
jgi:hypothetical protein